MTKEETFIDGLGNQVGFEDDEIFLLSTEEYERYKNIIPSYGHWWWLRSPSDNSIDVNGGDSVHYDGYSVSDNRGCVRPALRYKDEHKSIGSRTIVYDFPWIKIDEDLWVAEVPIGLHNFDEESNDYATSEIRQWLKEWKENRL